MSVELAIGPLSPCQLGGEMIERRWELKGGQLSHEI